MAFQRLGRDTATLRLLNRFQVFDRVAAVVTPPV